MDSYNVNKICKYIEKGNEKYNKLLEKYNKLIEKYMRGHSYYQRLTIYTYFCNNCADGCNVLYSCLKCKDTSCNRCVYSLWCNHCNKDSSNYMCHKCVPRIRCYLCKDICYDCFPKIKDQGIFIQRHNVIEINYVCGDCRHNYDFITKTIGITPTLLNEKDERVIQYKNHEMLKKFFNN